MVIWTSGPSHTVGSFTKSNTRCTGASMLISPDHVSVWGSFAISASVTAFTALSTKLLMLATKASISLSDHLAKSA
ncbi:hypothetical protein [Pseudarthrobacter sp. ATCC 49987]|uniref:hypothetical protein n=1 Tax=Pseudarthrobacter sp. ATCC 49987 TaxID=2698204 RepID=UPI001F32213A|nr:hypothetical protein [Pseudarthrobacter sp. ATCC 49987]